MDYNWIIFYLWILIYNTIGQACIFQSRHGYDGESDGVRFIRVREDLPVGGEVLMLRAFPRNSVQLKGMERLLDHTYFRLREINSTFIQILLNKSLEDLVDRDVPQNLLKFKIQCSSAANARSDEVTSYLAVTVYVEDVNDHYPQFLNLPYAVTVEETTPIGTTIFNRIAAFDRDKPNTPNSDVHFSLGTQDFSLGESFFALETPHRPSVILKRHLDYDDGPTEFSLQIIASDRGTPPKFTNTSLKIYVKDTDDLPPKFSEGVYRTRVNEFSPLTGKGVRVPLYFNPPIKAYDQDSLNTSLIYDIISGNERKLFWVNSETGILYLVKEIDLEEESLPGNTFVLQMEARQVDSPLKRALARVEVEIIDLNDNPPEFEVDLYNISIVENLPSGFSVLQVNAVDRDQGENGEFFYAITNEKPEGAFLIDGRTGWITVRNQGLLDREARSSITMIVKAVEKNEPYDVREKDAGKVEVEITLLDSNDNTPEFEHGNLYEFKVSVDAPIGHLIGHISAKDPDEGLNGLIIYELQKPRGSGNVPFKLDSKTGALTVASSLRRGRLALFVEASDQPTNPSERRFSLAVVTLEVVRSPQENFIDFIGAPYEFWVGNDVPIGTSVGQIRTTVDWDTQGEVLYDLLHSYPEGVPFAVEERSGTVTVIRDIEDFDNNLYEFEAVATYEKFAEDFYLDSKSSQLLRRTSKKLEEGVQGAMVDVTKPDDKSVLVTNVTVHVVSSDDERGILMKGTNADPIEFHVMENLSGALIGQLVYVNSTKSVEKYEELATAESLIREIIIPHYPRQMKQLSSTKFNINKTNLFHANTTEQSLYRRRHRDADNVYYVAITPAIEFEDFEVAESGRTNTYSRVPILRQNRSQSQTLTTRSRKTTETTSSYDSRLNTARPRYYNKQEDTKMNPSPFRVAEFQSRNNARSPRRNEANIVIDNLRNHRLSRNATTTENLKTTLGTTTNSPIINRSSKSDKEINQGLRFIIANQQDVLDAITVTNDGTLMTLKGLDREERDVYHLTVIAEYSKGFITGAGIYQVIIHVDDENDNAPLFNSIVYSGMITENSALGTEVVINYPIIVHDKDVGENAKFSLTLTGEGSNLFTIELVNGTVAMNRTLANRKNFIMNYGHDMNIEKSFANFQMMFLDARNGMPNEPYYTVRFIGPSILDRERESFYNLKMVAKDTGGLISEAQLGILIADVNDNAPIFEKIAVFKNAGVDVLQYSDDMDIYYADQNEIDIKNTSPIKLKNKANFMPSASVQEIMGLVNRHHIGTPRILDSNDTMTSYHRIAPNKKRQAKMEKTIPTFSVLENASIGVSIIKLTATDEDADYNSQVFYDIITETFIPNKIAPRQVEIMKYFNIDRLSGEVKINRPLPAESEFHLNVSASDIGGLADYTMLKFKILDVNDHPPVFAKSWYSFDIEEGRYTNYTVGRVEALDEDFGQNANLTYNIQSKMQVPFRVSSRSGLISITGELDRELKSHYDFKITATDSSENELRLSTVVEVEVNVLDINDNAPEFQGFDEIFYTDPRIEEQEIARKLSDSELMTRNSGENNLQQKIQTRIPVYKAYLNRNAESGTFVKQVTAIDKDFAGNGNGLVMYSLQHNKSNYFFDIDSRDGIISTVTQFSLTSDYEHINLTVIASDLGSPSMSSTALLLINLQGEGPISESVEDRRTMFPHQYYEIEVPENSPCPLILLTVNISKDFTDDIMKWSIVSDGESEAHDEFRIDPNNGTLWLDKSLDREIMEVYKIKIRAEKVAREGRKAPISMMYPIMGERIQGLMDNEVRIVIHVIDENDNSPVFKGTGRPIVAVIPNTANFGYPVTRVHATDADAGLNSEIRYSLLNEPARLFGIDQVTGLIRMLGPVSKFNQRVYGFDVKATDRHGDDDGRSAIANVFVYVLDENCQVRLILSGRPVDVEKEVDNLTQALSDATGLDVRVRMLEPHVGESTDPATDVYIYAVDPKSNAIINMAELQEAMSLINMHTLNSPLPIIELAELGGPRHNGKSHGFHAASLSGPELASIILAVTVFAGGLSTALCIICVRYKRRRTIIPRDAGLAYSVTRAPSSTVRTVMSKSSMKDRHSELMRSIHPSSQFYPDNILSREREYIDVPLPKSVFNTNFNMMDHDPSCLRFNQIHNHPTINVENSATSLQSSGRDSGLDLSRERSETPSKKQQQQQRAPNININNSKQATSNDIQSTVKCPCGHNDDMQCNGGDSSDSYEDSLKNEKIKRQSSLPRGTVSGFRKSFKNPLGTRRGIRHSFSVMNPKFLGIRDDLIQGSPGLLHRQQINGTRSSMTNLEERLMQLDETMREPFVLNNSHC